MRFLWFEGPHRPRYRRQDIFFFSEFGTPHSFHQTKMSRFLLLLALGARIADAGSDAEGVAFLEGKRSEPGVIAHKGRVVWRMLFPTRFSTSSRDGVLKRVFPTCRAAMLFAFRLSSGLLYKVLRAGAGEAHPKASTSCECHYAGQLIDGTTFDSSYDRGEPTSCPDGVDYSALNFENGRVDPRDEDD